MNILYNLAISLYGIVIRIVSLFNEKADLWIKGRKGLFDKISREVSPGDKPIWFHAASLGEFEQGRPIIEELRRAFPGKKILLTFYSPSGYEVRKDCEIVDWVYYLPLDTKYNSDKFVELVNPEMAIFIKYEFWPNIINALNTAGVNTIVVSAIFREDQVFFKSYGGWMRKSLLKFSKIFVQDDNSLSLLNSIGVDKVEKSGDTRFDRVMDILKNDNSLDFVEKFKADNSLLVAGSTWPDDDKILVEYINTAKSNTKVIIAPHNISGSYNEKLLNKISKKAVLYSEMSDNNLEDFDVFILDTVGILTKVYSYADIAYVGGGFGKEGVHNVLEPAVFSVPVVTGPIFHQFREAVELSNIGGMITIDNYSEFAATMTDFENGKISNVGKTASKYIEDNSGAQKVILDYITENIMF
ncbi:MAG: glycosyltransferase N-terminal domain-containing protein [Bacteroidota bacterium]